MSVTWHNGQFVERLALEPNERGLMLGDGVFETVLVQAGKPVWLAEHLSRMAGSAEELGLPFDANTMHLALAAVMKQSSAPAEVLRITLTRGPTPRGLAAEATKPNLFITLNPFDRGKLPADLRLATSIIRRNVHSIASRMKTLSYIDAIAAAREVASIADDALMLNASGNVASTTVANVFLLSGIDLITPALDQGILAGVTRQKLLQAATLLGLHPVERTVIPAELYEADSVFLTSALRLATPVSSLDGKSCGNRDISFINAYLERNLT